MAAEAMATVAIPAAARLSLMTYPFSIPWAAVCFPGADKLSFIRASSGLVCHWVAYRLRHCGVAADSAGCLPVTYTGRAGSGLGTAPRGARQAVGPRRSAAKSSPQRLASYREYAGTANQGLWIVSFLFRR